MRTGKETVCHFSLHRAAGPLPFLSCGKAKPGVHVMARDRDGTDSTPNSFPLCSSGTYSVFFHVDFVGCLVRVSLGLLNL